MSCRGHSGQMGRLMVFLSLLALSGCQETKREALPPIAADLPAETEAAGHVFQQRVQQRFPVGTPEGELISTLKSQGFVIHGATEAGDFNNAILRRDADGLCQTEWSVRWRASQRRLSEVWAVHFVRCV